MSNALTSAGDSLPLLLEKCQLPVDWRVDRGIDEFFKRNGFDPSTRLTCDHFARSKYALARADPSPSQGYCSYTLCLPDEHLLQFRPQRHRLNMNICVQARDIYPSLAPMTAHVGTISGNRNRERGEGGDAAPVLEVYLQKQMPGVSLTRFRFMTASEHPERKRKYRCQLIKDMAGVFATTYIHRSYPQKGGDSFARGKVGRSVRERLKILEGLPQDQKQARRYVQAIQKRFESFESAAWCLTHGDLVPENILVDPQSGKLSGLIDWAEAEWLPFGTGLYGLEELFGESNGEGKFEYYVDHGALRDLFWRRFLQITQPFDAIFSPRWLQDVRLCRALGILLWRGIAFDDGRLDRVVDVERDASEIQKLDIFLEAPEPLEGSGWKWKVELLVLFVRRFMGSSSGGLCPSGASAIGRLSLARRGRVVRTPSIKPRTSWLEVS